MRMPPGAAGAGGGGGGGRPRAASHHHHNHHWHASASFHRNRLRRQSASKAPQAPRTPTKAEAGDGKKEDEEEEEQEEETLTPSRARGANSPMPEGAGVGSFVTALKRQDLQRHQRRRRDGPKKDDETEGAEEDDDREDKENDGARGRRLKAWAARKLSEEDDEDGSFDSESDEDDDDDEDEDDDDEGDDDENRKDDDKDKKDEEHEGSGSLNEKRSAVERRRAMAQRRARQRQKDDKKDDKQDGKQDEKDRAAPIEITESGDYISSSSSNDSGGKGGGRSGKCGTDEEEEGKDAAAGVADKAPPPGRDQGRAMLQQRARLRGLAHGSGDEGDDDKRGDAEAADDVGGDEADASTVDGGRRPVKEALALSRRREGLVAGQRALAKIHHKKKLSSTPRAGKLGTPRNRSGAIFKTGWSPQKSIVSGILEQEEEASEAVVLGEDHRLGANELIAMSPLRSEDARGPGKARAAEGSEERKGGPPEDESGSSRAEDAAKLKDFVTKMRTFSRSADSSSSEAGLLAGVSNEGANEGANEEDDAAGRDDDAAKFRDFASAMKSISRSSSSASSSKDEGDGREATRDAAGERDEEDEASSGADVAADATEPRPDPDRDADAPSKDRGADGRSSRTTVSQDLLQRRRLMFERRQAFEPKKRKSLSPMRQRVAAARGKIQKDEEGKENGMANDVKDVATDGGPSEPVDEKSDLADPGRDAAGDDFQRLAVFPAGDDASRDAGSPRDGAPEPERQSFASLQGEMEDLFATSHGGDGAAEPAPSAAEPAENRSPATGAVKGEDEVEDLFAGFRPTPTEAVEEGGEQGAACDDAGRRDLALYDADGDEGAGFGLRGRVDLTAFEGAFGATVDAAADGGGSEGGAASTASPRDDLSTNLRIGGGAGAGNDDGPTAEAESFLERLDDEDVRAEFSAIVSTYESRLRRLEAENASKATEVEYLKGELTRQHEQILALLEGRADVPDCNEVRREHAQTLALLQEPGSGSKPEGASAGSSAGIEGADEGHGVEEDRGKDGDFDDATRGEEAPSATAGVRTEERRKASKRGGLTKALRFARAKLPLGGAGRHVPME